MAHKIFGRITDQASGQPVWGARVEAWDSDTPGDDDLMGYTTTDSDGRYAINYANKNWDTKLPGLTTFRPDIYLVVQRPNIFGQMINAKTTSVKSNWKMADDLEWNLSIPNRDHASTVRGTVKWAVTGLPAAGLSVVAYEIDKGDDGAASPFKTRLGEATTDDKGWYVIGYKDEGFDDDEGSLTDTTSWRPDIQIVASQQVGPHWTQVGESRVNWDVKFVEGLVADLVVSRLAGPYQPAQNG